MSAASLPAARDLIRRRPVIAAVPLAVVMITAVVVLLATSGGDGERPKYVPAGVPATVISSSGAALHVNPGPAFQPSASALAAASRLPLSTQVGQLFLVTVNGSAPAGARQLAGIPWGGVVLDRSNFHTVRRLAALVRALKSQLRSPGTGTPLVAATQEGGRHTAFPPLAPTSQATLGAAGSAGRAEAQAQKAGRQLRRLGVMMTLSPLADVNIPSGALTGRLFGSGPGLVTRLTSAEVAGYAQAGEISAVGHFPGAGAASADPDRANASVGGSLAQLEARDLLPFAAVAPQAPVILMSNATYVAFDAVTPASISATAVSLLRQKLRYQGVVMSDDLDATLQPSGLSPGAAAVQALQAGDDLLYISGPGSEHQAAYSAVLAAAQHSSAVEGLVREALLRVLSLKARYGLLH